MVTMLSLLVTIISVLVSVDSVAVMFGLKQYLTITLLQSHMTAVAVLCCSDCSGGMLLQFTCTRTVSRTIL